MQPCRAFGKRGSSDAYANRREVRDYADVARLGYVTRARVTQIMNLALLAPDIQEELLLPQKERA